MLLTEELVLMYVGGEEGSVRTDVKRGRDKRQNWRLSVVDKVSNKRSGTGRSDYGCKYLTLMSRSRNL